MVTAPSFAVGWAGAAPTAAGGAYHLDAARRVADDGACGSGGSGARHECGDSAARRTTYHGAGSHDWTRLARRRRRRAIRPLLFCTGDHIMELRTATISVARVPVYQRIMDYL